MSGRTALRWSGYIAFAVVFAIACGFLANWQFTRNADREHQLALVAANYDTAAAPVDDVLPAGDDFDPDSQWRQVILVGRYLAVEQLLVRNRPHGGTSAFEVLVPFQTTSGRVMLVDRGWVPPGADQPEPDEIPAPPGEPLPRSGRGAPEGQVPTIHLPLVADTVASGSAMVTDAYGVMVSEDPAVTPVPQPLATPSEDPGPHLSYAIQWILFAIMGFVFIWYMIRTERKHRREDAATDGPVTPTQRRRRDRDMQEEDALVDASGRL